MPTFDQAYADDAIERLERIPEDATPAWGKMNRAQLYGHLNTVIRYCLPDAAVEMEFRGNFKSKYIFKPLILNGLVAFPKNIKLPRPKGMKTMPPPPEATLDEVREAMKLFADGVAANTLPTKMHPFFGPLTCSQWGKFHVGHTKHHLLQFNVGDGL